MVNGSYYFIEILYKTVDNTNSNMMTLELGYIKFINELNDVPYQKLAFFIQYSWQLIQFNNYMARCN